MIPEVTSSDTVSFVDALAARENNSERNYDADKSYDTVSKEHQATQAKQQNPSKTQSQQPQTNNKQEDHSEADPAKIKKATKNIVDKVKKLSNANKSDETIDEVEIDEELEEIYFLLFNIIEAKLDQHVDQVTGGIANIDLKVDSAVDQILAQAQLIDATKDLAQKIQTIAHEILGDQIDITEFDLEIDPSSLNDINIQFDNLIQEHQKNFDPDQYSEFNLSATEEAVTVGEKVRGLVNIINSEEVQVVDVTNEQITVEDKRPVDPLQLQVQINTPQVNTKDAATKAQKIVYELPVAKDTEFKVKEDLSIKTSDEINFDEEINLGEAVRIEAKNTSETKVDINAIKEEIGFERTNMGPDRPRLVMKESTNKFEGVDDTEVMEADIESNVEDLMADSSSADTTGDEALLNSQQEIQTSTTIKMPTRTDTVKPIDISAYLQEQVTELPKNSRQEIKLQLNPENLGKIDLTISKNENNEVSIRMMFHDAKTLTHLKTDLKDNLVELKEALKLKNLDLSKFEVGQSKSSSTAYDGQQQQQSESYNEARDEQKDRLLNTTPEWLGVADQESFKEVAQNI